MKREHRGQFEVEKETASPWKPKSREQHVMLLEKYPVFWGRKMLAGIVQGNTKTPEMIREEKFPRTVLQNPKSWREADVRAWIEEQDDMKRQFSALGAGLLLLQSHFVAVGMEAGPKSKKAALNDGVQKLCKATNNGIAKNGLRLDLANGHVLRLVDWIAGLCFSFRLDGCGASAQSGERSAPWANKLVLLRSKRGERYYRWMTAASALSRVEAFSFGGVRNSWSHCARTVSISQVDAVREAFGLAGSNSAVCQPARRRPPLGGGERLSKTYTIGACHE